MQPLNYIIFADIIALTFRESWSFKQGLILLTHLVQLKWRSSGFAELRNSKRICHGIRNSSNFSAERRNSSYLPDADFLENDKRDAEFS